MDKDIGNFIVMLIQTIVFTTPVLILFYHQGRKDQRLDEAIKDTNGLGIKISETRNKIEDEFEELKNKIGNIERSIVRITTAMEFITEAIKELKSE